MATWGPRDWWIGQIVQVWAPSGGLPQVQGRVCGLDDATGGLRVWVRIGAQPGGTSTELAFHGDTGVSLTGVFQTAPPGQEEGRSW